MANRCPGCNKFPAYTAEDPEIENIEVDAEGHISGDVHLMVVSECCSEQMREASISFTGEVDIACPAPPHNPNGYHVETYGGGQYGAIAWYPNKKEADEHVQKLMASNAWSGMPPRVTPGRQITEPPPKPEVIPHTPAEKIFGVHDSAIPPEETEEEGEHPCASGHDLEVQNEEAEATDKYEGKGRGQKHFYGAKITGHVKCTQCDDVDVEFEIEEYIQFSSMDECC